MACTNNKPILFASNSLKQFFLQTVFGTAFTYLTGGVYLSGLAILMGAGDVLVSYLSIIMNMCGMLILVFLPFLKHIQSQKRLTIGLTILSKFMTILIVMIPVLIPKEMQLALFIPIVIIAFTLQAQTTVALNQWMLNFINKKKSGQYISLRQTLTLIVTVILSFVSGYWMDFMEGKYIGFVVLFLLAGWMGILELALLVHIPDSESCVASKQNYKFQDIVKLPLKNKKFMGFVIYIFLFYMLLYISDSFTMVYMMKYLELPYKTVNIMYVILTLPQVILLGFFGRLSDKRGHDFVLKTSIWLFAGETLFMSFASLSNWYIVIPVAFLISSVANAGFVIAVFNRRYELMPEENKIIYDNFYTAVIGLGFIFGPMIGGAIKGWLETSTQIMDVMIFGNIRVLYQISTVGIIVLQIFFKVKNIRSSQ